jgi:hypothetical protein
MFCKVEPSLSEICPPVVLKLIGAGFLLLAEQRHWDNAETEVEPVL